jgi:hypothetical protein
MLFLFVLFKLEFFRYIPVLSRQSFKKSKAKWENLIGFISCKYEIVKVMPLCLLRDRRYSCAILDLGTRLKRRVSLAPRPLYLQQNRPGVHWVGVWVGPTASTIVVEKIKILLLPGLESRPSSSKPISIQAEVSRLLKKDKSVPTTGRGGQ